MYCGFETGSAEVTSWLCCVPSVISVQGKGVRKANTAFVLVSVEYRNS